MSEIQIKVNNIEELVIKVREFVASQGGADKVSRGNISANSPTYTYQKNGYATKTEKGYILIELRGENSSSVKFKMEVEDDQKEFEEFGKFGIFPKKTLDKALAELNKIIPDTRPKPPQNEIPQEENKFQPHSFNIRSIPCSSLEEVKKQIKDFYQKNYEEIKKKPNFSQWIEITELGLFSNYQEIGKNGETIATGPHNTATITLKGVDRIENGKVVNQWISCCLKIKGSEEWGDGTIDWPEKELKNYWNTLLEQKGNPSAKNLPDKIEQLKQEISELKNFQTENNPEKEKELKEKEKKLKELLESKKKNDATGHSSNSNLVFYLSIIGIILLISGLFLIKLLQKRKKIVK